MAFILHDTFGFEFPVIAELLDTTPAAALKRASRCRRGPSEHGVGSRLYSALLGRLADRGLHVAVARISQPNPASESMHARLGFERVGVLRRIGFKNAAWHDVAMHQLELADAAVPPGGRS